MSVVVVTGGAGYIGSHATLSLLRAGFKVVVLDDCSNSHPPRSPSTLPPSLERVLRILGKEEEEEEEGRRGRGYEERLFFHLVCLRDGGRLREIFGQYNVDVVLHFAASKSVGESVRTPLPYYYNNLTSTTTLLQVMGEVGCKRLVFSSSSTVYGAATYFPTDEEHPVGTNLKSPYGRSKYFCETIMKDVAKSDKDWRIVILRYFNPGGAHHSGLLGESVRSNEPLNLLPRLAEVAAGERERVDVYGGDWKTEDGTCVRDYMHVVDLAEGHLAAVVKVAGEGVVNGKGEGGIVNGKVIGLVDGKGVTGQGNEGGKGVDTEGGNVLGKEIGNGQGNEGEGKGDRDFMNGKGVTEDGKVEWKEVEVIEGGNEGGGRGSVIEGREEGKGGIGEGTEGRNEGRVWTYNLGRGRGVSVMEMIKTFSSVCGRSLPYHVTGRRLGDVMRTTCSGDLARKELDWNPVRTLHDICMDTWRFKKMNPKGY